MKLSEEWHLIVTHFQNCIANWSTFNEWHFAPQYRIWRILLMWYDPQASWYFQFPNLFVCMCTHQVCYITKGICLNTHFMVQKVLVGELYFVSSRAHPRIHAARRILYTSIHSWCSFLNARENTQVARAMTSVFLRNARWRQGRSRGETKYRHLSKPQAAHEHIN